MILMYFKWRFGVKVRDEEWTDIEPSYDWHLSWEDKY